MLWKKSGIAALGFYSYMIFIDISTTFHSLNGHDSGTDWLEVPTIYKAFNYIIYKAYVREYPHKIWPYVVLMY